MSQNPTVASSIGVNLRRIIRFVARRFLATSPLHIPSHEISLSTLETLRAWHGQVVPPPLPLLY